MNNIVRYTEDWPGQRGVTNAKPPSNVKEKESWIPLVLTYHPLNNRIKRMLLENFKILSDDPETKESFPQPPMVTYRRDRNLIYATSWSTRPPAIRLLRSQALLLVETLPVELVTTYQMTPLFMVPIVPLISKNHSLVTQLASYSASHADASLLFISAKLGALLGNVLENTHKALPSVRPAFLSQST